MLTLRNNLHKTEARIRPRKITLTKRQMQRVAQKLCGIPGCTCGVIRGPQPGIEITRIWSDAEKCELYEITYNLGGLE